MNVARGFESEKALDLPKEWEGQGFLALAFQEILTVAARVRQHRIDTSDPLEFRNHARRLLGQAEAAVRPTGYPADFPRLAVYASVALLDETVLNTDGPLRAEWVGYPLQQELFGENIAGENFYHQLEDLLGQQESESLADLLEVYLICLLLGFQGRYAASDGAEIRGLTTSIYEKIRRIRGGTGPLSSEALLPDGETVPDRTDPWISRLVWMMIAGTFLGIVLFVCFSLMLRPGVEALEALADTLA